MNQSELDQVRRIVYDENAIVLGPDKAYLIESRLRALARALDFDSPSALLRSGRPRLRQDIAEAMTTNETSFFRDSAPFAALREELLPELIRQRGLQRQLRIWSAACSTGQEPYSIAMLLRDAFPLLSDWDVQITASDYSQEVLAQARAGRYSQLDVRRGLSLPQRARHFLPDGAGWVVRDELRAMVRFQQFNLLGMWPVAEPQDIILVRNVLIYFDDETRARILERARRMLRPGGFLLLGSAESPPSSVRGLSRELRGGVACYRPEARRSVA